MPKHTWESNPCTTTRVIDEKIKIALAVDNRGRIIILDIYRENSHFLPLSLLFFYKYFLPVTSITRLTRPFSTQNLRAKYFLNALF